MLFHAFPGRAHTRVPDRSLTRRVCDTHSVSRSPRNLQEAFSQTVRVKVSFVKVWILYSDTRQW